MKKVAWLYVWLVLAVSLLNASEMVSITKEQLKCLMLKAEVCDIKSARLFFAPHARCFYKTYLKDREKIVTGYAGGLSLFPGGVE